MKKLFFAVVVGLILVSPAYAVDTLQIQMGGMNWIYDGSALFDAGASNTTGSGNPAQSDPLTNATFIVNGGVVGMLTSNVWFDAYIPVGALPATGTVSGTQTPRFGFDLLTNNATPGWGIALNITDWSVNTSTSGVNGSLTGNMLNTQILNQNLPFGLVLGAPVTVSFSGNIFSPVGAYTSFTAAGTAEITGTEVPEPASLLLLGAALVGIAGIRRRMKK